MEDIEFAIKELTASSEVARKEWLESIDFRRSMEFYHSKTFTKMAHNVKVKELEERYNSLKSSISKLNKILDFLKD